jgi:hypothetical protein
LCGVGLSLYSFGVKTPGSHTPERRVTRWGLVALLLALPAAALALAPHAPTCVFRASFDLPCPGCGLGHALSAALQVQLGPALASYPPLLPLALGYGLVLVCCLRWARSGRRSTTLERWAAGLGLAGAAVAMVTWIGRMLG